MRCAVDGDGGCGREGGQLMGLLLWSPAMLRRPFCQQLPCGLLPVACIFRGPCLLELVHTVLKQPAGGLLLAVTQHSFRVPWLRTWFRPKMLCLGSSFGLGEAKLGSSSDAGAQQLRCCGSFSSASIIHNTLSVVLGLSLLFFMHVVTPGWLGLSLHGCTFLEQMTCLSAIYQIRCTHA
jgi:hypothetical protein